MRRLSRRWHRVLGAVMLLPIIGWAVTGATFFLKPGYSAAYGPLQVRDYALEPALLQRTQGHWREARQIKTVLGLHLLVRDAEGWKQLDPVTLTSREEPTEEEVRVLVADAIASDAARYGQVVGVSGGNVVETSTGVRIKLNWSTLSLSQRGPDTDRIDFLYRVHYLQWTGNVIADRILGGAGIVILLALACLGARLLFAWRSV